MHGTTVEPMSAYSETCTGFSAAGTTTVERLYAADLLLEGNPAAALLLEFLNPGDTGRGGRVSNSPNASCLGFSQVSAPYTRAAPLLFLFNQYRLQ